MKKNLVLFFVVALLFISCGNLHFTSGTSVTLYLPPLGQTVSNQGRQVSPPQGFDQYAGYDVSLLKNGKIQYQLTTTGGTVAFESIAPGSYTVDCKSFYKRNTQKAYFAAGESQVSVISGLTSTVEMTLSEIPVILRQPSDGYTVKVENGDMEYSATFIINSLDGVTVTLYKNGNYCRELSVNDFSGNDCVMFSYKDLSKSDELPLYDEFYYILKNNKTGTSIKTNTFKIYYFDKLPESGSLKCTYKGTSTIDADTTVTTEDFSAVVTVDGIQLNLPSLSAWMWGITELTDNKNIGLNEFDVSIQKYSNDGNPVSDTVYLTRVLKFNPDDFYDKDSLPDNTDVINNDKVKDINLSHYLVPNDKIKDYNNLSLNPTVDWYICDANGKNRTLVKSESMDTSDEEIKKVTTEGNVYLVAQITVGDLPEGVTNAQVIMGDNGESRTYTWDSPIYQLNLIW